MAKLSKEDKIHIFEEWKLEDKGTTYLSKKYGVNVAGIRYLIALINKQGISILDKGYTSYTKEFKVEAIKRVLLNDEAAYAVALDLGLPSNGMLSNWIRSYKENGYKNRKDDLLVKNSKNKELEKLKKENEELRRQNLKLTVENAFIKKLDALVQKRESQPKQK